MSVRENEKIKQRETVRVKEWRESDCERARYNERVRAKESEGMGRVCAIVRYHRRMKESVRMKEWADSEC